MEKKIKMSKNSVDNPETVVKPNVVAERHILEGVNGNIVCRTYEPALKHEDHDPVIMCPGFGASLGIQDKMAKSICAQAEATILTMDHPVGGEKDPAINRESIDEAITIQASNIMDMIDAVVGDDPHQKVMLDGHSMGAISVLVAAAARAENVSGVVLMNPAGLIGKDTPARLSLRFVKDSVGWRYWLHPLSVARYVKGFTGYIGKNIKHIPSQIGAIARSDTRDLIKQLSDDGIPISIIISEKDKAFPANRIRESLGLNIADAQNGENLNVQLLTFDGGRANHGEPLFQPPAAEMVASTIEQMRHLEAVKPYYEERARRLGHTAII